MRTFAFLAAAVISAPCIAQEVSIRWTKNDVFGGDTTPRYCTTFRTGTFAVLSLVDRSGRMDGVLSSYGMDGATQWVKTLWSADRFIPRAMVKANSGDVYVVATVGPSGSTDTYIARVAPSGITVWAKRINLSAETRDDTARAAVVDSNDNLYITGEAYQQASVVSNSRSAFVTKISPGGNVGFTRYYSPGSDESATGSALAVNIAGDIAVCVQNTTDRVWKLDAAGVTKWVRAPIILSDCSAMIMDESGSIYLGGTRMNSGSDGAPAVQKMNSDGILQWTRWVNYDSAVSSVDKITSMKMDAGGNIYAAGQANYYGTDFALVKVGPTGDVLATRLMNSFGTNKDVNPMIEMGVANDIYMPGPMTGPSLGGFLLAKADTSATFGWKRYSPTASGTSNAYQGGTFNAMTGQFLALSHNTVTGAALLQCLSQPGTPNPDTYSVGINGTLDGTSVLANDTYAADGTVSLVNAPTHGSLTLNSDGTFTYIPSSNYSGPDTFTYRVIKPGLSASATTTVTINVQ